MKILSNQNRVVLSGRIYSDVRYSHSIKTEKLYSFDLSVTRESGIEDIIPVVFSDRTVSPVFEKGDWVCLSGSYRSRNRMDGDISKSNHILEVFATNISESVENRNFNRIELDGYICKSPLYRVTPLGREICDILVAVNRGNRKIDYIPLITWGGNASFSSKLEVGSFIEVSGRIQSRPYSKYIEDSGVGGHYESRIAYEVSCSWIGQIQ